MTERIIKFVRNRDCVEAFWEFVVVWLLSFTPLFLHTIWCMYHKDMSTAVAFLKNFEEGEIFVQATALLAPVVFTMYKIQRSSHQIPFFLPIQVVLYGLLGGCLTIFWSQLAKPKALYNFLGEDWANATLVAVYIMCLMLWYCSLVINNLLDHLEEDVKEKVRKQRPPKSLSANLSQFKVE